MRIERITEAKPALLSLTPDQADALVLVGRRLASQAGIWGDRDESDPTHRRSVIECEPHGHGRWRVKVHNAVGVVSVSGLQIVVEPKIPLDHLLHLFARSGAFPHLDIASADLASAATLWPLVAQWYIDALERLLRTGLANGYRSTRNELPSMRGRLLPGPTMDGYLKGRLLLHCDYEEFDADTPLNRTIKQAAVAVARSTALSDDTRHRARRTLDHMRDVGTFRPADASLALAERHTLRYAVPLQLAKQVLASLGRGIDAGNDAGYGFLIRTPNMVEEALRRVVSDALAPTPRVTKRGRRLKGSHHTLNPDLDFESHAVGDVKYKVWQGDWLRADLYQLTAFATGFSAEHGLRIGFAAEAHGTAAVQVGQVRLETCDWLYDSQPPESEQEFRVAVRDWWSRIAHAEGQARMPPQE